MQRLVLAISRPEVDLLIKDKVCIAKTKDTETCTHRRTFWDAASQRIPLIFLLLSQSFNHNKTPLLCRPLYIVLEDGWHTCTNTKSKWFSSLRLVRPKSGEIGSLSCVYWIKFFVSHYQDIWSCLITNTNVNTHGRTDPLLSITAWSQLGFQNVHLLWKLSSDNETTWLHSVPTKNMHICILCHVEHNA